MSDFSMATLVNRTQWWMIGFQGRPLNSLAGAIDDTAEEITLNYGLAEMKDGSYVCIDDELLYVWEVNSGAKRAIVQRGQFGTEAAEHDDKAIVESASRAPRTAIKQVLREEIMGWPDSLWKPRDRILSLPANVGAIDAGVRDEKIAMAIAVDRSPGTAFSFSSKWTPLKFRLDRRMPRDSFPSGCALSFFDRAPEAHEVRFLYGERFVIDSLDDAADPVDDWGLAETMCDIPPLGAAAKLVLGREIQRSDTTAMMEPRVAADVPATYQTQTANALRLQRNDRINTEANRLLARFRRSS